MTSTPTLPTPGKHVPLLDGIRGLAIALVMVQHFVHDLTVGGIAVDKVAFAAFGRGWVGVDLFFVLSGFLITGILWDAKGGSTYFRTFYWRRVLRIFPAYYSVLIVFFVVLPALGAKPELAHTAEQWWHWVYLTNFRLAAEGSWFPHHLPNVFWSLAIEEQFYLVWPFVVLVCRRRVLMAVCGGLFIAAMLTRLALVTDPEITWVTSFVLTPARMDGLALGSFLALAARSEVDVRLARRLAIVVAVACLIPLGWLELQRPEGWRYMPVQTLRFSLIALIFGALVWLGATQPAGTGILGRLLGNAPMRMLGKYSYALYLWHGPVGEAMIQVYNPNGFGEIMGSRVPHALSFIVVAGAASLFVAWSSWNLLEKHFLKLKDRFPVGSRSPPPGL